MYQQSQHWLHTSVFEAIVNDLRMMLRLVAGRDAEPSAVIFDNQTVQSTLESGVDAVFDGGKKQRGVKFMLEYLGAFAGGVYDRRQ